MSVSTHAARRVTALLLTLLMLLGCVDAGAKTFTLTEEKQSDGERVLRGFDEVAGAKYNGLDGYQFMYFGSYPFTAEGEVGPVLWKVLGIEDGYALLWSNYAIDYAQYNSERIAIEVWKENTIYHTLNERFREAIFTEDELRAVRYSEDLGWLFYLTDFQLRKTYYGFKHWKAKPQKPRECYPTPYALMLHDSDPDKYQMFDGRVPYFGTDIPRKGCRSLIGFDGHTSVTAVNRYLGVRPACWVDITMLDNVKGSGTFEDPFTFTVAPPPLTEP